MSMIKDALSIAYKYINGTDESGNAQRIKSALVAIAQVEDRDFEAAENVDDYSYEEAQDVLSRLNEKESIRRAKGVYYTPADVVRFIVGNSILLSQGALLADNMQNLMTADVVGETEYRDFCRVKKVLDPTCGAGEFLLAVLEQKFDVWEYYTDRITKADIERIVGSVHGNDINRESTVIAKLRLFLCAVKRYGMEKCWDLPGVLNTCFTTCDYVVSPPDNKEKYDLILGNPPYVEDAKSGLNPEKRYGNIYANVLVNGATRLKEGGAFGFIIPLSYVATPRMKGLRNDLYKLVPEQYILSYSDRPDCLFASVHQKLCILFCRKSNAEPVVHTGNYQYWYKEERKNLFANPPIVQNNHVLEGYIPKLGTGLDISIYEKVTNPRGRLSLMDMTKAAGESVYLNMRAAFWIKAFRKAHQGSEYKCFCFDSEGKADYGMCILNSSLFWWYWVCVSDCWHITRKELLSFMVPQIEDYTEVSQLAAVVEARLEETKAYVGTVQTDYEYKHKLCVPQIHRMDDYINALYGLTQEESDYIKQFAHIYRVSGGVTNERD